MPLWLFAVVWVAAWAACRFVAWRWWPGRFVATLDRERVYITGECLRDTPAGMWVTLSDLRPLGGARRWAPFVATAVAFAVEAAWRLLA